MPALDERTQLKADNLQVEGVKNNNTIWGWYDNN